MSNNTCTHCSTALGKSDFTCNECGKGFCKLHVGTNEKFKCSKCATTHTRESAAKFGGNCPSVLQSSCPKCAAQLRLNKLPAGQHYLECDKCGWNSFEAQPIICYQFENVVLKEAAKLGIVRTPKACGGKLKRLQGKEFCPSCFLSFLKTAGTVSFSTIGARVEMDEEDVHQLLLSMTREYNLTGIIDEQNKLFTFLDPAFKDRVNEQVKNDGFVSIDAIAKNLGIAQDQALNLMFEIIRKERLRGTFSKQKKMYYSIMYIQNKLVEAGAINGKVDIHEFAERNDIHVEIVKDAVVTLLKTKQIDGFFAEKGTVAYTRAQIQDMIMQFAQRERKFTLEAASTEFGLAVELIRTTIHELVKQGRLRGVFTQKREYLIDVALKDEIIQIVRAYRTITLSELARRLAITERTVEESLASLVARGDLSGYIDLRAREFRFEQAVSPPVSTMVPAQGTAAGAGNGDVISDGANTAARGIVHDEKFIEVVREYDFIGGQVHFKVAIRNNSSAAIFDVKTVLDFPDAFQTQEQIVTIPVIEPGSSRGVDFFLEPTNCGKSNVSATVIYKDFTSKVHTIHVERREIWIKCPLVVSTMDTLEDVRKVIQTLPSDARSFLISDIDARLAYHAGFRAISHFDARCVHAPEQMGEDFEAEAFFATKAKQGGRIVIKLAVSERTQILEIRVWCAEAGQLTGLLAKIVEYLFQEINVIRKIKAESRERTIDLMAIAQGITVLSDYAMLGWKFGDITNKLQDIYARVGKFMKSDDILDEMQAWLERLREHGDDEAIPRELGDQLGLAVDKWQDAINRKVAPA